MSTIYDADYFIEKFSGIPDELWFEGEFASPANPECKSALGHCGASWNGRKEKHTKESGALLSLFGDTMVSIYFVNNGESQAFIHPTPKGRVLAALAWIKTDPFKHKS